MQNYCFAVTGRRAESCDDARHGKVFKGLPEQYFH